MRILGLSLHRARHAAARPRIRAGVVLVAAATAVGALAGPAFGAQGTPVTNVTMTPGSNTAGATSIWSIGFTPSNSGQVMKGGDTITVTLDSHFSFQTPLTVTLGTGFSSCTASTAISGNSVIITLSSTGSGSQNSCSVAKSADTFTLGGIANATSPGSYPGLNFSLTTSQDTIGATSGNTIVITAAPSKLAFTTQPSATATAGTAFARQPVVTVQDSAGNTATGSSASVTLAITGSSVTLSCTGGTTVNAVNGVASFTGCSISKSGSYTLTATASGLTSATSAGITVSAAAASALVFTQPPSSGFAGSPITPAVSVQVQDALGNPVTTSGVAVTLAPSAGSATGTTATTDSSGTATFANLTFANTVLGTALTASASGTTSVTAGPVNITVKVTSSAAALTDTAADAGSGVRSVAYYYCAGYSGSCTAATGTKIGSSTSAAGNYPVTWTGQPANGAYRVVAVADDNVANTGTASAATPVTVSN